MNFLKFFRVIQCSSVAKTLPRRSMLLFFGRHEIWSKSSSKFARLRPFLVICRVFRVYFPVYKFTRVRASSIEFEKIFCYANGHVRAFATSELLNYWPLKSHASHESHSAFAWVEHLRKSDSLYRTLASSAFKKSRDLNIIKISRQEASTPPSRQAKNPNGSPAVKNNSEVSRSGWQVDVRWVKFRTNPAKKSISRSSSFPQLSKQLSSHFSSVRFSLNPNCQRSKPLRYVTNQHLLPGC